MEYRRLGRAGIKVSALSLGSWVTFGDQVDEDLALAVMQRAYEAGVNFFDNAEVYAGGQSEAIMGAALRRLGWPRYSYLISTKFYWGIHPGVNNRNTLNRKYLLEAMDGSLERLGLSYVDLAYCHRPDPETTIEETVFAMHDLVNRGKALYWAVSEWSAAEIRQAYEIAERHHLHKPVAEQPEYNLLHRKRVEEEYDDLYDDYGMGLTTWSPLASGVLTGKYANGIPAGSRADMPGYEWVVEILQDPAKAEAVKRLSEIAAGIGCTAAQLAIAFCLDNRNVSTVITGATSLAQLEDNLGALKVHAAAGQEVFAELRALTASIAG
ncbi:MAG: aldo/keto reductase [Nitrospiraceae bacterium]|nr:aldo/keto reductase [Nitrospiraceae bacterium]MDA8208699.1 aldo/keto reductase [Actinomycetota bacterium]